MKRDAFTLGLVWNGLVIVAVTASIATAQGVPVEPHDEAPSKPRQEQPSRSQAARKSLPALNQKVLKFARDNVGKRVGDGECATLALEALKAAGAHRFAWAKNGNYVWGKPVNSLGVLLPGDILQFRDTVFAGKKWVTKQRWISWHYEYPHHTAIVAEVRDGGRELVLLHQNVHDGNGDAAPVRFVLEGTIRADSLQPGGKLWAYRPVGPDVDDNAPGFPGPEPDRDPGDPSS